MSLFHRANWMIAVSACLAVFAFTAVSSGADQEEKPDAEKKSDAEKTDADKPADRYAVPEGDAAELLKFIESLEAYRPKSRQDAFKHQMKSRKAIDKAVEKILESESDKNSAAYQKATFYVLRRRVEELSRSSKEEKKEILDLVKARLAKKGPDDLAGSDVGLAMTTARSLEYSGSSELAADAYQTFGELLAKSKDPRTAQLAVSLQGAARRMTLLGNEMKVEGTMMDGKKFDWNTYRGKVVLVDVWATWCGPCRAELPNVKKNFEAYHDRGFDVVGVSVDRRREALESFLEKEKLPWVTLFENDKPNPVASYYGIMGIPTVILVDREGKVVSLRARGPELGRLLGELIGPAAEEKDEGEKKEEKKETEET